MGCGSSLSSTDEEREAAHESRRISRDLASDGAREKAVTKLLLLGAGDSGKSTIMKQVKLLHSDGFTREDLLGARPAVLQNVLASMRALLEAILETGGKFAMQENENNCRKEQPLNDPFLQDERSSEVSFSLDRYRLVLDSSSSPSSSSSLDASFPALLLPALRSLWRDETVRECYELRRHLLHVQDSAQYFFDNMDRIFAPNYLPSRYVHKYCILHYRSAP